MNLSFEAWRTQVQAAEKHLRDVKAQVEIRIPLPKSTMHGRAGAEIVISGNSAPALPPQVHMFQHSMMLGNGTLDPEELMLLGRVKRAVLDWVAGKREAPPKVEEFV